MGVQEEGLRSVYGAGSNVGGGIFFFFKQKTAYEMCGRDWSSDVCSSDLALRNSSISCSTAATEGAILRAILNSA